MAPCLRIFCIVFLPFLLTSCHRDKHATSPSEITVAVAASLMPPLEEIAQEFEKKSHAKVTLMSASSGVFTAQIMHGAPFDVFISANAKYPQQLEKNGRLIGTGRTFAEGTLMLWSKTAIEKMPKSTFLASGAVKTLGIANPDLAPFGEIAMRWLKAWYLDDGKTPKLIYGENIGSVNQLIAAGAVDAALTSASAKHAAQLRELGHWYSVDGAATIPHVVALVKQEHSQDAARQFIDYLFSDSARKILTEYGYSLPKQF